MALCFMALAAQSQETPNAQQARRVFNETYKMVFGEQGSQLHYKVNIIGIYKTEGTIWNKGKKSKFIDERYIAWNNDVTYYRYERKKNSVTIYDAHSDERDKYATKFKFVPDNYTYSIKDAEKTRYPLSVRIKVGIFHTTIKISEFKVGGINDDFFEFPREQYKDCKFIDKR